MMNPNISNNKLISYSNKMMNRVIWSLCKYKIKTKFCLLIGKIIMKKMLLICLDILLEIIFSNLKNSSLKITMTESKW